MGKRSFSGLTEMTESDHMARARAKDVPERVVEAFWKAIRPAVKNDVTLYSNGCIAEGVSYAIGDRVTTGRADGVTGVLIGCTTEKAIVLHDDGVLEVNVWGQVWHPTSAPIGEKAYEDDDFMDFEFAVDAYYHANYDSLASDAAEEYRKHLRNAIVAGCKKVWPKQPKAVK